MPFLHRLGDQPVEILLGRELGSLEKAEEGTVVVNGVVDRRAGEAPAAIGVLRYGESSLVQLGASGSYPMGCITCG